MRISSIIYVFLLLTLLQLQLGCSSDSTTEYPSEEQEFQLFILAGQSNMAGRGEVQPRDTTAPARVVKLNKSGNWVPATEPVHYDKPMVGVGPGRSFGMALASHDTTVKIGLIPCAVGGSSITTWKPGGFHSQTQTHPYDDCMARVQKVTEDGKLKAILWHQGASDSNPNQAPHYRERLHELIARFRSDVTAPDLPFIAGQLGRFDCCRWDKWRTIVNDANASLPENTPNTAFVSSEGLTHKGDSLHFDAQSARELGKRYAKAYIKLEKEKSQ